MLRYRLLLGPVLVLAFVGVIALDSWLTSRGFRPGMVFTMAMIGMGIAAAREITKIFRARSIATSFGLNALAVVLGLLISSLTPTELRGLSGTALVCTAAGFVMICSMVQYSRHHNTEGVVASTAATLLAFVYIGLMGGFLILLVKEFSGWVMLGVVLVTKSYDIGAYFTGRFLGRHKLIPWLSPGKTWEGLAGGMLASALMGMAAAALAEPPAPGAAGLGVPDLQWWHGLELGAVFGLIGQAGDLVASLLKRDAGMKDYSRALPGFGGIMDVADSPLLVAPVAYWLLTAISGSAGLG